MTTHQYLDPTMIHYTHTSDPGDAAIIRDARAVSDLHCLWRYCEKRACQRAHMCRNDPGHCLHFMPLVPFEARAFYLVWNEARQKTGLTYEMAMGQYPEKWVTLMEWRDTVCKTLPENIAAARQRVGAAQRARLNGHGAY